MPIFLRAYIIGGRRGLQAVNIEVLSGERALSLGSRARTRRVARLLTQRELAEIVGVSPEEVNLLENGQTLPPDVERKIVRQLGIAIS
jgi:DNA-binding XRE family transcriptional regulator